MLIRCESIPSGKPSQARFQARVVPGAEYNQLLIHGIIGDTWDELDSGSVVSQLLGMQDRPLVIDINSEGGFVYDGIAIFNALQAMNVPTTARVTGIAASAASLIAMGADEVEMAPTATLMIHRAHVVTWGNAAALRDMAAILDKIDQQLVDVYAARMKDTSREDIYSLMVGDQDGTYFNAEEAIAVGLADRVIDYGKKDKPKSRANEIIAAKLALRKLELDTAI